MGEVLDYVIVLLFDGGMLVIFVDVIDSVNVEWVFLEKNDVLQQVDQIKNVFIQYVFYELWLLLINIIGFVQFLLDLKFGDLSEK